MGDSDTEEYANLKGTSFYKLLDGTEGQGAAIYMAAADINEGGDAEAEQTKAQLQGLLGATRNILSVEYPRPWKKTENLDELRKELGLKLSRRGALEARIKLWAGKLRVRANELEDKIDELKQSGKTDDEIATILQEMLEAEPGASPAPKAPRRMVALAGLEGSAERPYPVEAFTPQYAVTLLNQYNEFQSREFAAVPEQPKYKLTKLCDKKQDALMAAYCQGTALGYGGLWCSRGNGGNRFQGVGNSDIYQILVLQKEEEDKDKIYFMCAPCTYQRFKDESFDTKGPKFLSSFSAVNAHCGDIKKNVGHNKSLDMYMKENWDTVKTDKENRKKGKTQRQLAFKPVVQSLLTLNEKHPDFWSTTPGQVLSTAIQKANNPQLSPPHVVKLLELLLCKL
eukprot:gene4727-4905_t